VKAQYGGSFSPLVLTLTTFSSVFSGYTVMGVPQEASLKGYLALRWVPAIFAIVFGMLMYYPRLRRLSVERGYRSPNDFITDRYRSKWLRCLSSLCACVPQLFYFTVQLVSFAELLEGVTLGAVPKLYGMIIFAVIVFAMEMIGGMNSVVLSDVVQSVFMIFGFLVLLVVVTLRYGTLSDLASADCPSLGFVNQTAIDAMDAAGILDIAPSKCSGSYGHERPPECLAFGCIGAAHPEFLTKPEAADQAAFFFFLFNFLAFPLNPHMVQRAYIASSDGALRLVAMALVVAPFLTMTPGIVAGIVKASFADAWPLASRDASAFAALGNELKKLGPLEYGLVAMLTCSGMAAIMSTADSVILGVSNALSVDVFEGFLAPGASSKAVVRFGTAISFIMCVAGIAAGTQITSAGFGLLLTLQNGILLQIVPAFLFGLYYDVTTLAVTAGIITGILTFLLAWLVGNPLEDFYVPEPNFGAVVNVLVLVVVQLVTRGRAPPFDAYGFDRFGDRITTARITEIMRGTVEPSKCCRFVFLLGLLASIPFYCDLGLPDTTAAGFPLWAIIVFSLSLVCALLAFLAALSWRPQIAGGQCGDSASLKNSNDDAGYTVDTQYEFDSGKLEKEPDVCMSPPPLPPPLDGPSKPENRLQDLEAIDISVVPDKAPAIPEPVKLGKADFAQQTEDDDSWGGGIEGQELEEDEEEEKDRDFGDTQAATRMQQMSRLPRGAVGYATRPDTGRLAGGRRRGPHIVCCLFFRRVTMPTD